MICSKAPRAAEPLPTLSFSRILSLISRRIFCRRIPVTFPTDRGSFLSPRISDTRGLSEAHPCAGPHREGGLGPERGAPPAQAPGASGSPVNRGSGCPRDLGHAVCAPFAQLWPHQGHGPCFLWLHKLTCPAPPRSASTWGDHCVQGEAEVQAHSPGLDSHSASVLSLLSPRCRPHRHDQLCLGRCWTRPVPRGRPEWFSCSCLLPGS